MIPKNRAFWRLALGVSLTTRVCSGLALFESVLVANESHLTMTTPLIL